jgi:hypothetical protein
MERQVLSEAIQTELGDREVTAMLFCTHDLDPQFFEQEVLSVFIGNDLKHNRRTREAQLDYVIRERELPIDVFYEQRALATHEGAARLGWSRHRVRSRRGGVFHPKVVLALCVDDHDHESLVVSVSSANLTPSGWWRNVECADVSRIVDGQRHGYVAGLTSLMNSLNAQRISQNQPLALRAILGFLRRQSPYSNAYVGGRLVPQLLPGYDSLLDKLLELFGSRLEGAHLEIISPFFDKHPDDVTNRLNVWKETFAPRTFRVALPARDGNTTISKEIYSAVSESVATWSSLPRTYVRAAQSEDAGERSVHAKVYRFWRRSPDPLEVIVLGSHNLTGAAHSGTTNWEVSVVLEPQRPQLGALLEDQPDSPHAFDCLDEDLVEESADSLPDIPISVAYDWLTGQATARWYGKQVEPVTLLRGGRTICRIELAGNTWETLESRSTTQLAEVLRQSSILTCRRDNGREAPILVEELNHGVKPDLLESLDLTPAEIFALWSIPDLSERLRRLAQTRATVGEDEDDLELVAELPGTSPTMFDRFAGVFHAFASLRTRIDAAMDAGHARRAGMAIYAEKFDAPVNVLRIMRSDAELDDVHAYVAWGCARLLDHYVQRRYPELATTFAQGRRRLAEELTYEAEMRDRLVRTSADPDMSGFLDWFDRHFNSEVTA